ncbi:MAG: 8-demethyl-8-(2,3-dimethoxy-alpha-L-rhamnosyl)-tetracenomycin-C 4'-O-methyltransferase [Candidatus Anoxychlamydiales bacterium]|nr:8-demethyl-8-(2,3-dimethoxy-alpha-L-rhamnosyl)-tetracenomycin-C 4'-O-methyltransferase [Candidatus Anoxychlamydiales bacterium]
MLVYAKKNIKRIINRLIKSVIHDVTLNDFLHKKMEYFKYILAKDMLNNDSLNLDIKPPTITQNNEKNIEIYENCKLNKKLYDFNFRQTVNNISDKTLISEDRLYMLYQLAKNCKKIDGDIAEMGVYKGGSAKLISDAVNKTNKKLFLFDTFQGMPEVDKTKDNFHKKDDFNDTDIESVKKLFIGNSNVKLIPGFFPKTAENILNNKFCFVHIDADIYPSVLDSCTFFYPRMVKGGYLIFDDYGFETCKGAKSAVDYFFSDKNENVLYLETGQALVIKQ